MVEIKSIEQIAFEFWCDLEPRGDLEIWIQLEQEQLTQKYEYTTLSELPQQETQMVKYAVLKLAYQHSEFVPVSKQGERFAKKILTQESLKLLAREISPRRFCKLIHLFDTNFTGLDPMDDGHISYPIWLGDLWNCCDWCDSTLKIEDLPDLSTEVKKAIEAYDW